MIKNAIFRGSLFAGVGALLLLLSGSILPAKLLEVWGPALFGVALLLIVFGLLPYRNLLSQQLNPYELVVSEKGFTLIDKGKRVFSVPFTAIEQLSYCSSSKTYGIKVIIEKHPKEKVCVHNAQFDLSSYMKRTREEKECDLFLPYFSKSSFEELCEIRFPSEEE